MSLDDYHVQKQIINRFTIGQLLLSEPVMDAIRKQLKKVSDETKVSNEEICQILTEEIIKRDVLDGDKALEAKKKITKAMKATLKPPAPKDMPVVVLSAQDTEA
jgi:HD-like signal output (HDOD) protein